MMFKNGPAYPSPAYNAVPSSNPVLLISLHALVASSLVK